MTETFFAGLDKAALEALLTRTALQDAALLTVGPSLHIENSSEAAARLTGLHPLERVDQLLSSTAVRALRDCIARREAKTVREELDGTEYRLEMIPHRDGALLAFLRDDRASYDGTLRVLHIHSAQFLGAMLSDAEQVGDPALAAHMRMQCMRMHRMLLHSDFLHDPPQPEQLRLSVADLCLLCQQVVEETRQFTGRSIAMHLPERCLVPVESRLISTALFNLLANAVCVTPKEAGDISLTLRDDGALLTITVADRGPGLEPALFGALLSAWQRTQQLEDYLSFVREGAPPGLGLPLVQRIAQLHGGALLLSPRRGGGSELHLGVARLPAPLDSAYLNAPMMPEDGYSLAEIELACLDPCPGPQK